MDGRDGRGGAARGLEGLAARLGCSRAEAVAVAVLVAGAVAGLGLLWVLAAPRLGPAPPPPVVEGAVAADEPPASPSPAAPSPAAELVVHVAGRVGRPGVYRLAAGSRVAEAVEVAGGVLDGADVDGLNLARTLVDGEQLRVPAVGESPAPAPAPAPGDSTTGGGARRADGTLDLNLATLADLEELPGVGPVLAQRVLDHRTEIGRFTRVEELRDVKGIGEATYAELAPEVSV